MRAVVAGVDLGGTGSRFVICAEDAVIAQQSVATASFAAASTPAERLDGFARTIRALIPSDCSLAAVGIGASGPVDVEAGVVHNLDTLAAFSDFPLVQGVRERLGVPVAIDNDAVTAAVAEYRFGAGERARRMLMITLGTGIGAALLVEGAPFRGSDNAHPEAGHIPIAAGRGRCYCGLEGCWEHAASRAALQRLLRPLLPVGTADRNIISTAAADADRPAVRETFYRYGCLVGQGLAALHTMLMPDVTVIGGGAAEVFNLFEDGLRPALARAPGFSVPVAIRVARMGDQAGAVGAAQIALR